jgi:hypothetical protein
MSDKSLEKYLAVLAKAGGRYVAVDAADAKLLHDAWWAVFGGTAQQFKWHVFSFGHRPSLPRKRALATYLEQEFDELIVFAEGRDMPMVHLYSNQAPDFSGQGLDVYVWPQDLAWTMAFTNEESSGYGPYFAYRPPS